MSRFLSVEIFETEVPIMQEIDTEQLHLFLERLGDIILDKEHRVWELLIHQNLKPHIDISITDSEGIKEINAITRKIDTVTDVLSFPNFQFDYHAEKLDYQFASFDFIDPNAEEKRVSLGEIVICPEKVHEQSKELGHSYMREFSFLFMHGLLHLCGYDHMNEEEETIMFDMQKSIVPALEKLLSESGYEVN